MTPTAVHAKLAKHYPARVLTWVKRASWRHDPAVPLSKIDMSRRPGGRDPAKVAGIAAAITAGKPMSPVMLVNTGQGKYAIADGYHRTLGHAHAGKKTIDALIASGVGKTGPWDRSMHKAKINLAAPAVVSSLDLAISPGGRPINYAPLGRKTLWRTKGLKLPDYIRGVARGINPADPEAAVDEAVSAIRRWAATSKNPSVHAAAVKALAEWDAAKVAAHALSVRHVHSIDLAEPARIYHWKHGWISLDRAAQLKRDEASKIAEGAGVGDRAAGRLSAPGLAQAHRSTDSRLRRYTQATNEADALEHKARLAQGREAEANRQRLTPADVKGATHVQDKFGWHEVVRVNAKTVTVKTPHSWTDSIPITKVLKVARVTPEQRQAALAKRANGGK